MEAPRADSSRTITAPIPAFEPVTIATFPFSMSHNRVLREQVQLFMHGLHAPGSVVPLSDVGPHSYLTPYRVPSGYRSCPAGLTENAHSETHERSKRVFQVGYSCKREHQGA